MSIGLRGTARKSSTAATLTLNLTAGGSFTSPPVTGDVVQAIIYYTDDSGLPQFTGPAGWTILNTNTFVTGSLVFQIWERIVATPEATYTWTAVNNGQSGQLFWCHAFDLPGAWTAAYNPGGADPLPFRKLNQAGALTQTTSTANVTGAASALMAGFAYNSNAQLYTGLAPVNGVTPQAGFLDSGSVVSSSMAVATGLWIGPGIGVWTPTATAGGTFGQWGAVRWGIRAQPLPPQPPVTYPGAGVDISQATDERRWRRRRWLGADA